MIWPSPIAWAATIPSRVAEAEWKALKRSIGRVSLLMNLWGIANLLMPTRAWSEFGTSGSHLAGIAVPQNERIGSGKRYERAEMR